MIEGPASPTSTPHAPSRHQLAFSRSTNASDLPPTPVHPAPFRQLSFTSRAQTSAAFNADLSRLPARKWMRTLKSREYVRSKPLCERSLGCIPVENPLRRRIVALVEHKLFIACIMLVILINAIFLALYDPVANKYDQYSPTNQLIANSELAFILIYTIEMLLKITAYGLFFEGPNTYLKSGWFVLDFVIVILGWISFALDVVSGGNAPVALNVARTLRPLRALQYIPKIDYLSITLVQSRYMLFNVGCLFLLLAFAFDMLGLAAFAGKLHQKCGWQSELTSTWYVYSDNSNTAFRWCSTTTAYGFQCPNVTVPDPNTGNPRPVMCVSEFNNFPGDNITQINPWGGLTGFDNLIQGFLTIIILVSGDGWADYMAAYRDTNGDWSQLYFVLLMITCSTILLNLLIAVLVVNFSNVRKRMERPDLYNEDDQIQNEINLWSTSLFHDAKYRRNLVRKRKAQKIVDDMQLRLIWSYKRFGAEPGYSLVSPAQYQSLVALHSQEAIDAFGRKLVAAEKARRRRFQVDLKTELFEPMPLSPQDALVPEFQPAEEEEAAEAEHVPAHLPRGLRPGASKLERFCYYLVRNQAFIGTFIFLILLNTVILATVHFMQPIWMFRFQEQANLTLTAAFTVELIFKFIGLGVVTVFREPFDLFDLFIVVASWLDIVLSLVSSSSNSAGLTILRTLRVLRVFKIVRYIKAAARLLRILWLTILASLPFFGLFCVFMYVFTVSGLLLFGAEMNLPAYVIDPTSGNTIANYEWTCTKYAGGFYTPDYVRCPAASNYDTLMWALITSFQLLSRENWSDVMIHACHSAQSWAPVFYFIAVLIVGSYVVLNLFIAVIIDGFLQSQEALREKILLRNNSSLKSSKTSQSTPREDDTLSEITEDDSDAPIDFKKWVESRLNALEINPKRHFRVTDLPSFKTNMKSLLIFSNDNPLRVFCACLVTSTAFEYFVIGVILLACVLLIIENPSNANNPTLLALDYFVDAVFFTECIAKSLAFGFILNQGAYLRDNWNRLDFVIVVAAILDLVLANNPAFQAVRALRALRPLRLIAKIEGTKVAVIVLFRSFKPVGLVASMVCIFLIVFALFGVVLFGGLFYACLTSSNSNYGVYYDSFIDPSTGTYFVTQNCFPYRSYKVENCPPENQCVGAPGTVKWDNPSFSLGGGAKYSFDDIVDSVLILWESSTLSLYLEPLRRTVAATAIGHRPNRDTSPANSLFFLVFLLMFSFFFTQLFVASVVETFLSTNDRVSGKAFLTPKQQEWVDVQGKAHILPFRVTRKPPKNRVRHFIWRLIKHPMFDPLILTIIAINTVFLASAHYQMSAEWVRILQVSDYVFGSIYITEAAIKIVALGLGYFRSYRNLFDFFIVITIIVAWILGSGQGAQTFGVFQSIRVLRIFRLVVLVKGINILIVTLRYAIPAIINIGLLLFLVYFIYACMGVQLFYGFPGEPWQIEYSNFASPLVNFNSFANALSLLFRVSTLSAWNGVMHDYATVYMIIWPYLISFVLIVTYIMLNLFIAVLLANFTNVITKSTAQTVNQASLVEYRAIWAQLAEERVAEYVSKLEPLEPDLNRRLAVANNVLAPTMLPALYFVRLFVRLPPPLGFPLAKFMTRSQIFAVISNLKVPITTTGLIGYRATLKALVDMAVLKKKAQIGSPIESDVANTALELSLKFADRRQDKKSSRRTLTDDPRHQATSHDLSYELAARRVQVTARYLLAREKVRVELHDGHIEADEAQRSLDDLRLAYTKKMHRVEVSTDTSN